MFFTKKSANGHDKIFTCKIRIIKNLWTKSGIWQLFSICSPGFWDVLFLSFGMSFHLTVGYFKFNSVSCYFKDTQTHTLFVFCKIMLVVSSNEEQNQNKRHFVIPFKILKILNIRLF